MRVAEIAARLHAGFEGDGGLEIRAAAGISHAGEDSIVFASTAKAMTEAGASAAGCVLIEAGQPWSGDKTVIRVPNPRAAFAQVIQLLHPPRRPAPGLHPTAVVDPAAEIGPNVSAGAHTVIAEGARIGEGTIIGAGCHIGAGVVVGPGGLLHNAVTIYDGVTIGRNVIIHSGAVLGADGFGFELAGDHYEKFPQIGRVVIGDDVEIGANSCVDRAALGVTEIGDGTKLDNLVHVAHNAIIGKHVVIAAQTGISGGAVVEDYVVIAGQVGIADKVRIETRAILGAQCGVPSSKIIRSGQTVWGTPARPIKEYLAQLAQLPRIAALRAEVAELKQRLAELEDRDAPGRQR